jgi:CHAT domain-containing protein
MKPFYEGVAAGRGKLASLNAAKLRLLEERRRTTGAAHPFYWASFVLVGEP